MHELLLTRAIEQLHGFGIRRVRGGTAGSGADALDGGPELAPLRTIPRGAGPGLTHLFLGRLGTGHSHLG